MWNRIALFLLLAGLCRTAEAHPGHDAHMTSDGVWHYLTSPQHLIEAVCVLLVVCFIAAVSVHRSRHAQKSNPS